jgi:hypothetical protein
MRQSADRGFQQEAKGRENLAFLRGQFMSENMPT